MNFIPKALLMSGNGRPKTYGNRRGVVYEYADGWVKNDDGSDVVLPNGHKVFDFPGMMNHANGQPNIMNQFVDNDALLCKKVNANGPRQLLGKVVRIISVDRARNPPVYRVEVDTIIEPVRIMEDDEFEEQFGDVSGFRDAKWVARALVEFLGATPACAKANGKWGGRKNGIIAAEVATDGSDARPRRPTLRPRHA